MVPTPEVPEPETGSWGAGSLAAGTTTGGAGVDRGGEGTSAGAGAGGAAAARVRTNRNLSPSKPAPVRPPPPPPAGPGPPASSGDVAVNPCEKGDVSSSNTIVAWMNADRRKPPGPSRLRGGGPAMAGEVLRGLVMSNDTAGEPQGSARRDKQAQKDYGAAGAASLGVTPITFTPAPRDTSMAQMTSAYFTVGCPFTKMILSGRGS